jgi:sulfate transporter 4
LPACLPFNRCTPHLVPQVKYILGLKIPRTDRLQDSLSEIFSNLDQFKWREWCMAMAFIYILLAMKEMGSRYK